MKYFDTSRGCAGSIEQQLKYLWIFIYETQDSASPIPKIISSITNYDSSESLVSP